MTLFCLGIHYGGGNDKMWYQYAILDIHGVTNIVGLWILKFQPHMLKVFRLDYCHFQTTAICGTVKIFGGGGGTGRAYLV